MSGEAIRVERVGTEPFARMRGEWNDLVAASAASGPMLTWEWMFSWWEAYERHRVTRELAVLLVRDAQSRLLGIAPFVRRPVSCFGVRLRRLEFLGTGEDEADETCSEFLDVMADPERNGAVVEALADRLASDDGWDEIVCRDVRADRPSIARDLAEALRRRVSGLDVTEFGHARCPFITLPATWDEYLSRLSGNSRRLVRAKRRHAVTTGGGQFASAETGADIRATYPEFKRLHQQRWRAEHRPGCFASGVFDAFLDKVTERLAESGGVRIACFRIRGDMAAAYYLLRYGKGLYYYNSGMDTEKHGEFSPGSVCQGYIIEEAIRAGLAEYHFLKGGARSYKYHWTAETVPVVSLRIRKTGAKQTWCRMAEGVRRRLSGLRAGAAGRGLRGSPSRVAGDGDEGKPA